MEAQRLQREQLSEEECRALDRFVQALRGVYGGRLRQAIVFNQKRRAAGADLDLLVILDQPDRAADMARLRRIVAPITAEMDVLITPLPVDATEFARQPSTGFFARAAAHGLAWFPD